MRACVSKQASEFEGSVRTLVTAKPNGRAYDAVGTTICAVENVDLSDVGALCVPEHKRRVLWSIVGDIYSLSKDGGKGWGLPLYLFLWNKNCRWVWCFGCRRSTRSLDNR